MIEKYKLFYRTFVTLFWVMTCWGFFSQELVPMLDGFETIELMVVDFVFLLLGICTIRKMGDVMVIAVFGVLAVVSTLLINHLGALNLFNGSRDFFGILLGVPIVRWFMQSDRKEEFITSFDKQLKYWLYVQAFCLTWQFIKYGANDAGGGSFGYGSSGMVSTLIYMISFYLLSKNWDYDNLWQSVKANKEYLILLYPTLLNETKISFIYMMVYFILLVRYDRKFWLSSIVTIPVTLGAMFLMFNIYTDVTNQDSDDLLTWEFLEHYLVTGGEDLDYEIDMAIRYQEGEFDDDLSVEWWTIDMPRFAKMILIGPVVYEQPGGIWAGTGVGTLKSGRSAEMTRFARLYKWLLNGTRTWLLFLFVELGIPGILWWLWAYGRIALPRKGMWKNARRALLLVNFQILLLLFYSDFLRTPMFMVIVIYILFVCRNSLGADREQEQSDTVPA